ncbi:membrane dipeptidase [Streptomyces sp. ISL-36]|uniref:membrane dipeptidase n=1 Tax=Streptomyces sp. ISL-36 TaxID=2819182 RepID=UPI001BE823CD|nr:membrane dipeptidase [Streptomyces sp. ISL-36]MBT2438582.1 membrane dipeptidase [Streptomyces sp. ISL-36]
MADLLDDPPALSATCSAAGERDAPAPPPAPDEWEGARALLAAHPVVEGRAALSEELDADELAPEDLPPVRTAEAGAQFWSLHGDAEDGVVGTLRRIDAIRAVVAACPEELRLAHSTAEMADARNCGRVAALLGPVSWGALGGSLAILRSYQVLGVRAVNLTRFDRFAREAVREMNRLGVLVDLSGADLDTVCQTLAVSKAPAVLTRADPETLPDDALRLLGRNGAVCMVPVADDPAVAADALDRVHALAGPLCVGLSGAADPTAGYAPLFAELLRRGWDADDLAGLAHVNATRALREAEFLSRAARLRRSP